MPSQHKFAHWRYKTAAGRKTGPMNQNSRGITIEKTEFIGRNFSLSRKPNFNPNPLKVKVGYNSIISSSDQQAIFK